ncbi:MAG: hybrid sensor histidine kinase/response regulator [Bacteroidales bacterium]|nr:hybrid sensor histidine kinase/response regulator [Bacteroidales bacterium]
MEKLKVLVVDDEPGIRSGISRILSHFTVGFPFMDEDFSFEILEARTGEEALEITGKEKTDIILLDNKLPGMYGIDVLDHLNKTGYDAVVMMITSYASLDLAVKATRNGAYNFVPKPFTPSELKAAMESITKHLFLKRMTRKMGTESREARFQFLSVLSHELKSPVNAVEGYLQIMKDRQAGKNMQAYEIMIDRSLERLKGMRTLIMDLLDLTRLESGGKARNIRKTDISEILRIAVDNIRPLARQKEISIHPDITDSLFLNADPTEIEIIFNNLLSNAVKYNRQNGEVYVSMTTKNRHALISVADTGIGMSGEEVSKLFQEFVRIKNVKTKNITGSGLGLSIVKKLTGLYGGSIDVESQPDAGSRFMVTLPLN